jgi:hypothetical protein
MDRDVLSHKRVSEKEWCEMRCYQWLVLEEDQKILKELSFGTTLRSAAGLPGRNLLYTHTHARAHTHNSLTPDG